MNSHDRRSLIKSHVVKPAVPRARVQCSLSTMSPRSAAVFAVVFVVAMFAIAGCSGRTDIEDGQRAWLEDQHAIEKRLVDAWRAHDTLRRAVPADHSRLPADEGSRRLYLDADTVLTLNRRSMDAIDAMIDRHSLARDNAIRSDNSEAVETALKHARKDYAQSSKVLDTIADQFGLLSQSWKPIADVPNVDSVR